MRIPRLGRLTQPADANPSHATGTPRRTQSWPRPTEAEPTGRYFGQLPPENPNLLTAHPTAASRIPAGAMRTVDLAEAAAARGGTRPGCRVLAVSREAFEYEVAVGQNLVMLADDGAEVNR